jgi:hypothetical protein
MNLQTSSFLHLGGTMVKLLTHIPKVEGLNPVNGREKMVINVCEQVFSSAICLFNIYGLTEASLMPYCQNGGDT